MPATTGLNRLLGPLAQERIQELRRQALVAQSEVVEEATAAGTYPRTVDVLRREETAPAQSSIGVRGTWTTVAGLSGLTAHVRTHGTWFDAEEGQIDISGAERVVLVADIPAGGDGAQYDLLASDRLRWTDPVYGEREFEVVEVRNRNPDGIVAARCRLVREP